MTQEIKVPDTGTDRTDAHTAGAGRWLKRCWQFVSATAHGEISAWQAALLARRKLTHPAEVMKMREPVRPTTRATWFR